MGKTGLYWVVLVTINLRENQGLLHGGGGGGGTGGVFFFFLLLGENVVPGDFDVGDLIHQLQPFRYFALRDPNVLLLQRHRLKCFGKKVQEK